MQTSSMNDSMPNISNAGLRGSTSSLGSGTSSSSHWNPGVFIDIDGVVLNGGKPYDWTVEAIQSLWNNKIPFVFVTNGTYCSAKLVDSLTEILHLPITSDHVIVAPSPCTELTEYHDKRVLVCCQQDSIGLISELGFKNYLTVEELAEIFPDLDYIDHNKRKVLQNTPFSKELAKRQAEFQPIEMILLLGEPINWECSLQLLTDVLMTNGDPRAKFKYVPNPHLPIIACNKDVTFKGAAILPRFGHGAFLECLEALFKKITKNELVYEDVMGKPYLITYEYAANQIQRLSPNGKRINKFYIIGDNPEVDIKGANLYREHLDSQIGQGRGSRRSSRRQSVIEEVRHLGKFANQAVESILVCTGVYNPQNDLIFNVRKLFNAATHQQSPHTQQDLADTNNNFMNDKLSSSMHAGCSIENENVGDENEKAIRRHKSYNSFENDDINEIELSHALQRKNSFISYFDDTLNLPDHIFDNLKHSVEYIIKSNS